MKGWTFLRELIKSIITDDTKAYKSINELKLEDYEFIFSTKLSGILFNNFKKLNVEDKLLSILKQQRDINFIRNINVIRYASFIDSILDKENIERCWIKGIRDIFLFPSMMDVRQMADVDIIVKDTERTRNILLENGLEYGGYDYNSNWISGSMAEVKEFESNHYELFPLSKKITIYSKSDLDTYYLSKAKIHKTENDLFTDIIFDVHRELTFDLQPDWIFKRNTFFPVMNQLDDLWYMINKCFYEILQGDSINLQSLVLTLKKIKSSDKSKIQIKERLIKTGFYNADALDTMYGLAKGHMDKQEIDSIINYLVNKISKELNR